MKYKLRIDYSCQEVQTGGKWFYIEGEKPKFQHIGLNHKYALLPPHQCKIGRFSTNCEGDINCVMQKILEIRPIKATKRLEAKINN